MERIVSQFVRYFHSRRFPPATVPRPGTGTGIVISDKLVEPRVDLRNSAVFHRTLFTRDDQVVRPLDAGMDACKRGREWLEIRRFGFSAHRRAGCYAETVRLGSVFNTGS